MLVAGVTAHHRWLVVPAAHVRLWLTSLVTILAAHLATHVRAAHVGTAVLVLGPSLSHIRSLTLTALVLVALLAETSLPESGVLPLAAHLVLNGERRNNLHHPVVELVTRVDIVPMFIWL